MRLLALTTLILFLSCSGKKAVIETVDQPKESPAFITVKFHYIPPYCGGAAPTEEMEKERLKGLPWSNKEIYYLIDGKAPKKGITNDNGALILQGSGDFCFKMPFKVDESIVQGFRDKGQDFDESCLKEMTEKCDLQFTAHNDTTVLYTIYGRCAYQGQIPCMINLGPPPP